MSEKFNYNIESSADQGDPKDETVAFGISKKDWLEIQNIAQVVGGGDYKTEVKLGKPGGGSFTDLESRVITLDPLNIKDKPIEAKFVAGHEGSHRAVSPGPKEMGLSEKDAKGLYSQVGFGYTQNAIEDPAINGWMRKKFPGLDEYVKKNYDSQFEGVDKEGGVMVSPEVSRLIGQLGYNPKFAQFGTEVIRDWHSGKFGDKLDPEVKKSLKRTIESTRKIIKIIPDTKSADRKEVVEKGTERFQAVTEEVWPEVKRLVELDLKTEEKRQMMDNFRKKQKELEDKKNELDEAQKQGDKEKEEELKKDIEKLEKELAPLDGMSDAQKKELEEKVKEAVENGIKQLGEEVEQKNKEIKEAGEKKAAAEKELENLKEKYNEATDDGEKEKLEKQIKQKEEEKQEQEARAEKAQKELEEIEESMENSKGEAGAMPFPEDALSPELNKTIEKIMKSLPGNQRRENQEKAEKQLQQFEDAIKEHVDGDDVSPSHEEIQKEKEQQSEADKNAEQERIERENLQKELERKLKESMTPYERARAEVVGQIDDLYYRLRKILKPEEYGSEESGYSSGQLLDITRAMQADHDFEQKQKMFIRETLPAKKDYRFWHLVDLSGSMYGEKIEETYKGFITVGEAVDRLENSNSDTATIHQGISGFNDQVFDFKDMNERFSSKSEEKLSKMPAYVGATTNTYIGTVKALEGLNKNLGESGNYLLTFTDGSPNFEIIEPLKKLLKDSKSERDVKHIKVGLIWLGEAGGGEEMLNSMVKEYGYDFGLVMPAVQTNGIDNKESFAERLGTLLEGLVKNPEMY